MLKYILKCDKRTKIIQRHVFSITQRFPRIDSTTEKKIEKKTTYLKGSDSLQRKSRRCATNETEKEINGVQNRSFTVCVGLFFLRKKKKLFTPSLKGISSRKRNNNSNTAPDLYIKILYTYEYKYVVYSIIYNFFFFISNK